MGFARACAPAAGVRCYRRAAPRGARGSVREVLNIAAGFGRGARLTESAQYRRVFERPVQSRDAAWTVLARSNGQGHARLGLAISKKNIARAVARHRIKRLARESFRINRNDLPAVDIVVLCRPDAARKSNRQLFDALNKHWRTIIQQCTGR